MLVADLLDACRGAGARVYALQGSIRVEGQLPSKLTDELRLRCHAVGLHLVAEARYERLYSDLCGLMDRDGVTPEVEAIIAGPYAEARARYLELARD